MVIANSTGDEQQPAAELFPCSSDLTAGLHGQVTFFSVFNSFFSLTAFLGNALIIIALHKESSLHPPSKLLIRCLATTDLCVGLITEPLAVASWISIVNEYWNICGYVYMVNSVLGSILPGVSLLAVTAISVDRLLALLLGLRYKQVVTLKQTYIIVIMFWVVQATFSAVLFWNPLITLCYAITTISLCLVTSIFSYSNIFLTLRLHQNQQPNQANQVNMERYKKAVCAAIWLQLTLVACYLPSGITLALMVKKGLSSSVYQTWSYTLTLVFLNSSLNQILYCWKIEEVRQAVKNTIRQILCHCFSC